MPDYQQDTVDTWTGPSDDEIRGLWEALRQQWSLRNGEYLESRKAYDGDHWEGMGLSRPDNRYSLTANYQGPMADKEVQIMMGQLPAMMVVPSSAEKEGRDHAERLEALLYGNWDYNDAHLQLLHAAWNAIVLRRGLIHYWWDPGAMHVRWQSITPDNFFPVYDGQEIVECIYVSRRLTRALKRSYPQFADDISADPGMDVSGVDLRDPSLTSGGVTDALATGLEMMDEQRENSLLGYTTVVDYYDNQGAWVRLMGRAVHRTNLGYPTKEIPFIEVPNSIRGEKDEPKNSIDHITELNQYYNILLSQAADIIKKYSNPPIIDMGSGVDPAKVHSILSGDGGVLPIRPNGELKAFAWEGNQPDIPSQMTEVKDLMFDLSGKPRSSFGQTVTNQSGVVTNLALTPTLQSNELRQTVWGFSLARLNKRVLELYEEFAKGHPIEFKTRGWKYKGAATVTMPLQVSITGEEIQGWYQNQMKWPSSIRVDDPVYVDTELKKMTSEPQAQSVYDTLENLGVQDVEARIDRIKAEREDPRLHPEVLEQTVASLTSLSGLNDPAAGGLQGGGGGNGDLDTMSSGEAAMSAGMAPAEAV